MDGNRGPSRRRIQRPHACSMRWCSQGGQKLRDFLESRGELTTFRRKLQRAVGVTPGPPTHGREPGRPFFGEF